MFENKTQTSSSSSSSLSRFEKNIILAHTFHEFPLLLLLLPPPLFKNQTRTAFPKISAQTSE